MADKWIWLPKSIYPENRKRRFDALSGAPSDTYTVAEFKKNYSFEKKIKIIRLRFSGDTSFQLFCNGEIIATGPASVGGDFLGNGKAREWFYATETEYSPKSSKLEFFDVISQILRSMFARSPDADISIKCSISSTLRRSLDSPIRVPPPTPVPPR